MSAGCDSGAWSDQAPLTGLAVVLCLSLLYHSRAGLLVARVLLVVVTCTDAADAGQDVVLFVQFCLAMLCT